MHAPKLNYIAWQDAASSTSKRSREQKARTPPATPGGKTKPNRPECEKKTPSTSTPNPKRGKADENMPAKALFKEEPRSPARTHDKAMIEIEISDEEPAEHPKQATPVEPKPTLGHPDSAETLSYGRAGLVFGKVC